MIQGNQKGRNILEQDKTWIELARNKWVICVVPVLLPFILDGHLISASYDMLPTNLPESDGSSWQESDMFYSETHIIPTSHSSFCSLFVHWEKEKTDSKEKPFFIFT